MMNQSEQRSGIRLPSLLITAAAAVFTGIIWANNLVSAWRYHCVLFRGEPIGALPAGFLPGLTWTAIDVSTVTTFIPFFGFLLMFSGLLKIRNTEYWPFFHQYDRLNIALGLIGTLWGIILIGFYPSDQVSISALMSCLHTAMFSTLAAIVWVMVLEPLIFLPWMSRIRKASCGMTGEEKSLNELADTLLNGLDQAGKELKGAGEASAAFREELNKLNAEVASLITAMEKDRELESAWRENTVACIRDLAAVAEGFRAQQERLSAENAALTERCGRLDRELASSVEEASSLKRRLDAIRKTLEG